MNRRNFLLGSLATTAAGLLVKADTPGIEAFASTAEEPVTILRPEPMDILHYGTEVFDRDGRLLGHVTEIRFDHDLIDVSSSRHEFAEYAPGIMRTRMTVVGHRPIGRT